MAIVVPAEGRPAEAIGAAVLEGVDGNAFFIMGATQRELKRAGASKAFTDAYYAEATSGDYDHLIAASVAYLEAE